MIHVKIEFWLDFLCPKCYIQHKNIVNLLQTYEIHNLELIYRNYEMVDDDQMDPSMTHAEFIASYRHLPLQAVEALLKQYNLDIKLFRIHDVHRMSHLAKRMKKQLLFIDMVFKAIYEDGLDLSNHDILKKISLDAGLPEAEIDRVLSSDLYHSQVLSNKENAQLKRIFELPTLRINGKLKMQGLQSEQSIIEGLNKTLIGIDPNEFCEGEHCIRKRRNPS